METEKPASNTAETPQLFTLPETSTDAADTNPPAETSDSETEILAADLLDSEAAPLPAADSEGEDESEAAPAALNPDDINPLVPAWQLLQEEISPAVAAASAAPAAESAEDSAAPALYTQAEYDKLFRQYQQQKARADALQDSFFASADVMYEMLAYLNASRLYHGKDAIMASDINGIVENNPILNTLANDLRQTSIESGIGIVSELPESQEHLREHVMNVWRTRMAEPGERDRIHAQLFTHRNIPDGEELF